MKRQLLKDIDYSKIVLGEVMKYILIWLIKLYKKIPGPWHNYCRHQPTCSTYAIMAIEEHGSIYGTYLATKRIFKCNPWGTSGYDPVPEKKGKKI